MDFQRARTEQQVESRHAEILNACAALYEEAGADGVTIKAIAQRTSFSRPSIYNYYDTKEEILLDLLQRECGDYTQELRQGFAAAVRLDRSAFCRLMTDALLRHEKMLRLMSVNLNSIENNVDDQRLLAFKKDMAAMFDELRRGLEKFFPESTEAEREMFVSSHFCFIYGLYPASHPSRKQTEAMEKAGFKKAEPFEKLCYEGLMRLASSLG